MEDRSRVVAETRQIFSGIYKPRADVSKREVVRVPSLMILVCMKRLIEHDGGGRSHRENGRHMLSQTERGITGFGISANSPFFLSSICVQS